MGGFGMGRARMRMPRSRGGRAGGLGAIIVVIIGLFLGVDPMSLLGGGSGFSLPRGGQVQTGPNQIDDQSEEFVGVVLADTEDVWASIFQQMGQQYQPPKLVLFSGQTSSACGAASAASGPFYCPGDYKAYLDTQFFQVMSQRLGAAGDFAAAYVIAHEVAHHVQNLLGILPEVNRRRARASEVESNRLSVMIELQADCFSGVWTRHAQERFGVLEEGDISEALNAARQIGDDTLQRNAGRAVVPDSFQHGSAEQRMRWFQRGMQSGDPRDCDTFSADRL
jgi:predicted metalloprotease